MKKIYFISPDDDNSLSVWYRMLDANASGSAELSVGYNDSYEMRSIRISSKYFSDDFEKLRPILEQRKRKALGKIYKALSQEAERKIPEPNDAKLHNSINCPF